MYECSVSIRIQKKTHAYILTYNSGGSPLQTAITLKNLDVLDISYGCKVKTAIWALTETLTGSQ